MPHSNCNSNASVLQGKLLQVKYQWADKIWSPVWRLIRHKDTTPWKVVVREILFICLQRCEVNSRISTILFSAQYKVFYLVCALCSSTSSNWKKMRFSPCTTTWLLGTSIDWPSGVWAYWRMVVPCWAPPELAMETACSPWMPSVFASWIVPFAAMVTIIITQIASELGKAQVKITFCY